MTTPNQKVTVVARGFLPCGKDPTNELGHIVFELSDGKIIYNEPYRAELHLQSVSPDKIPLIQWGKDR